MEIFIAERKVYMSKELIDVAEVTNTHGLRGEVKIMPRTDYPEFFEEISGVYLEDNTYLKITGIKYQKNMVITQILFIDLYLVYIHIFYLSFRQHQIHL